MSGRYAHAERRPHVAPTTQSLPQRMGRLRVGRRADLCLGEAWLARLQGPAERRRSGESDLCDEDRWCELEAPGQRPFRARSNTVGRTALDRVSEWNQLYARRPGHSLGSAGAHVSNRRRWPQLGSDIRDLARGARRALRLIRVQQSRLLATAETTAGGSTGSFYGRVTADGAGARPIVVPALA